VRKTNYCRALKTRWPTEFLERRELQLIVEAGAYPVDSPQSQHLVHLSRRLLDALLQMEGIDPAALSGSAAQSVNSWPNWTDPDGIEMFAGGARSTPERIKPAAIAKAPSTRA
jgi:hypothetical protein